MCGDNSVYGGKLRGLQRSQSIKPSVIPVIEVNQSGGADNQCPRQLKVMNKIMMVLKAIQLH